MDSNEDIFQVDEMISGGQEILINSSKIPLTRSSRNVAEEEKKSFVQTRQLDDGCASVSSEEEEEQEEKGKLEDQESKVTIQQADSDEEEKKNTINTNNMPADSTIKSTLITKQDSDLHEFSYDDRKFFVRLNQYNGIRVVNGYLKKLCHEKSVFFQTKFEMRFCIMDMNVMNFQYAKSPKDKFQTIGMEELVSCSFEDPKRKEPIKLKNQKSRQGDLKYLLFLIGRKRTYALSANTRCDQVMWFNAFQVFFKVKHVINLVKNGTAFSKQSLQMLEEARQKELNRSRESNSISKVATVGMRQSSKRKKEPYVMPKGANQIGIKSNLDKAVEKIAQKTEQNSKTTGKILLKGKEKAAIDKVKSDFAKSGAVVPSQSKAVHSTEINPAKEARPESSEPFTKTAKENVESKVEEDSAKLQINRAQKIMQANYLKAAQMDDPIEREKAMSRLQILQTNLNKGEGIDQIEELADSVPLILDNPKIALLKAKEEAQQKQEINKTQIELSRIAEEKRRKEEEIRSAKIKLTQMKRDQSFRSSRAFATATFLKSEEIKDEIEQAVQKSNEKIDIGADDEYDSEYDEEIITRKQPPKQPLVQHSLEQKSPSNRQFSNSLNNCDLFPSLKKLSELKSRPAPAQVTVIQAPIAKTLANQQSMSFQRILVDEQQKLELDPAKVFQGSPQQSVLQAQLLSPTHDKEDQKTERVFGLVLNVAASLISDIELKPASQQNFIPYQKADASNLQALRQSSTQQTTFFQPQTQGQVQPQAQPQVQTQIRDKLDRSQKQLLQVLPPPSENPATVVDMLQSLQTIQVIEDDYDVKGSVSKNHASWEMHNGSQSDELVESLPAFIIKPFEESIGIIEADAQTAVKAFEAEEETEVQLIAPRQAIHSKIKQSSPMSQSTFWKQSRQKDNYEIIKINSLADAPQEQKLQGIPQPSQQVQAGRFQQVSWISNPEQFKEAPTVTISVKPECQNQIQIHGKAFAPRDFSDDFDFEEETSTFPIQGHNSLDESWRHDDLAAPPDTNISVFRSEKQQESQPQRQKAQKARIPLLSEERHASQQEIPDPIQPLPFTKLECDVKVQVHTQEQEKILASQASNIVRIVEPEKRSKQNLIKTSTNDLPYDLHTQAQYLDRQSNNQINQQEILTQIRFTEQNSEVNVELTNQVEQLREEIVQIDQDKVPQLLKQVSPKPKQMQQHFKFTQTDSTEYVVKEELKLNFKAPTQVWSHKAKQFDQQSTKTQVLQASKQSLQDDQLKIEMFQREKVQNSPVREKKQGAQLPKPMQAKQKSTQYVLADQPQQFFPARQISVQEIHVVKSDQTSDASSTGLNQDQVQMKSPPKDSPYLESHIEQPNSFKNFVKSNPHKQQIFVKTSQSRNLVVQNDLQAPQQQQQNSSQAATQEQTRRLYITRKSNPQIQSNPQENSVLLDPRSAYSSQAGRSQLNVSSNCGDLNTSSNTGEEAYRLAPNGNIKLSKEYINARNNMLKKGLVDLTGFDVRKSQRILKVVNIIGARATGKESSLSATRVSQIRQRNYKSKGEKVIFRHTGSREQLLRSSELGHGFTQVFTPDIPDIHNGRKSVASNKDEPLFNSKAKKNLLLLSSQTQRQQAATSANPFYPSSDTANLNLLLEKLNQEEYQIETPLDVAKNDSQLDVDQHNQQKSTQIAKKHRNQIRPSSLNKTTDIFKRANSVFNMSDALSPPSAHINLSLANEEQLFDDAINQQRDPFLIEKMEQQHKISMHRKNSASRASIESQKRSQREESIKERRQQRKQMAMQRQAQMAQYAQRNQHPLQQNIIPKPMIDSEFRSAENHQRWPSSSNSRARDEQRYPPPQRSVGLSDMFSNKQPSMHQKTSNQSKAAFNFHNIKNTQKSNEDDDKDSHFSEEW